MSNVLNELLLENQKHEFCYGLIGNNHAPMTMIAMNKIGASDSEIKDYFSTIKKVWGTTSFDLTKSHKIEEKNWCENLNHFDFYPRYIDFFNQKIRAMGVDKTLKFSLPILLKAPASAAFHPLIRLAYGIELNNPGEIAHALSYWCSTYLPSPLAEGENILSPVESIDNLNIKFKSFRNELSGNVRQRIQYFLDSKDFNSCLTKISVDSSDPFDILSDVISQSFFERQHFTSLHGVTSLHALRIVYEKTKFDIDYFQNYWIALCAAYLSVRTIDESKFQKQNFDEGLSWEQINKKAIKSKNEHVIKLSYTCKCEEEYHKKEIYKKLASRETTYHSLVF